MTAAQTSASKAQKEKEGELFSSFSRQVPVIEEHWVVINGHLCRTHAAVVTTSGVEASPSTSSSTTAAATLAETPFVQAAQQKRKEEEEKEKGKNAQNAETFSTTTAAAGNAHQPQQTESRHHHRFLFRPSDVIYTDPPPQTQSLCTSLSSSSSSSSPSLTTSGSSRAPAGDGDNNNVGMSAPLILQPLRQRLAALGLVKPPLSSAPEQSSQGDGDDGNGGDDDPGRFPPTLRFQQELNQLATMLLPSNKGKEDAFAQLSVSSSSTSLTIPWLSATFGCLPGEGGGLMIRQPLTPHHHHRSVDNTTTTATPPHCVVDLRQRSPIYECTAATTTTLSSPSDASSVVTTAPLLIITDAFFIIPSNPFPITPYVPTSASGLHDRLAFHAAARANALSIYRKNGKTLRSRTTTTTVAAAVLKPTQQQDENEQQAAGAEVDSSNLNLAALGADIGTLAENMAGQATRGEGGDDEHNDEGHLSSSPSLYSTHLKQIAAGGPLTSVTAKRHLADEQALIDPFHYHNNGNASSSSANIFDPLWMAMELQQRQEQEPNKGAAASSSSPSSSTTMMPSSARLLIMMYRHCEKKALRIRSVISDLYAEQDEEEEEEDLLMSLSSSSDDDDDDDDPRERRRNRLKKNKKKPSKPLIGAKRARSTSRQASSDKNRLEEDGGEDDDNETRASSVDLLESTAVFSPPKDSEEEEQVEKDDSEARAVSRTSRSRSAQPRRQQKEGGSSSCSRSEISKETQKAMKRIHRKREKIELWKSRHRDTNQLEAELIDMRIELEQIKRGVFPEKRRSSSTAATSREESVSSSVSSVGSLLRRRRGRGEAAKIIQQSSTSTNNSGGSRRMRSGSVANMLLTASQQEEANDASAATTPSARLRQQKLALLFAELGKVERDLEHVQKVLSAHEEAIDVEREMLDRRLRQNDNHRDGNARGGSRGRRSSSVSSRSASACRSSSASLPTSKDEKMKKGGGGGGGVRGRQRSTSQDSRNGGESDFDNDDGEDIDDDEGGGGRKYRDTLTTVTARWPPQRFGQAVKMLSIVKRYLGPSPPPLTTMGGEETLDHSPPFLSSPPAALKAATNNDGNDDDTSPPINFTASNNSGKKKANKEATLAVSPTKALFSAATTTQQLAPTDETSAAHRNDNRAAKIQEKEDAAAIQPQLLQTSRSVMMMMMSRERGYHRVRMRALALFIKLVRWISQHTAKAITTATQPQQSMSSASSPMLNHIFLLSLLPRELASNDDHDVATKTIIAANARFALWRETLPALRDATHRLVKEAEEAAAANANDAVFSALISTVVGHMYRQFMPRLHNNINNKKEKNKEASNNADETIASSSASSAPPHRPLLYGPSLLPEGVTLSAVRSLVRMTQQHLMLSTRTGARFNNLTQKYASGGGGGGAFILTGSDAFSSVYDRYESTAATAAGAHNEDGADDDAFLISPSSATTQSPLFDVYYRRSLVEANACIEAFLSAVAVSTMNKKTSCISSEPTTTTTTTTASSSSSSSAAAMVMCVSMPLPPLFSEAMMALMPLSAASPQTTQQTAVLNLRAVEVMAPCLKRGHLAIDNPRGINNNLLAPPTPSSLATVLYCYWIALAAVDSRWVEGVIGRSDKKNKKRNKKRKSNGMTGPNQNNNDDASSSSSSSSSMPLFDRPLHEVYAHLETFAHRYDADAKVFYFLHQVCKRVMMTANAPTMMNNTRMSNTTTLFPSSSSSSLMTALVHHISPIQWRKLQKRPLAALRGMMVKMMVAKDSLHPLAPQQQPVAVEAKKTPSTSQRQQIVVASGVAPTIATAKPSGIVNNVIVSVPQLLALQSIDAFIHEHGMVFGGSSAPMTKSNHSSNSNKSANTTSRNETASKDLLSSSSSSSSSLDYLLLDAGRLQSLFWFFVKHHMTVIGPIVCRAVMITRGPIEYNNNNNNNKNANEQHLHHNNNNGGLSSGATTSFQSQHQQSQQQQQQQSQSPQHQQQLQSSQQALNQANVNNAANPNNIVRTAIYYIPRCRPFYDLTSSDFGAKRVSPDPRAKPHFIFPTFSPASAYEASENDVMAATPFSSSSSASSRYGNGNHESMNTSSSSSAVNGNNRLLFTQQQSPQSQQLGRDNSARPQPLTGNAALLEKMPFLAPHIIRRLVTQYKVMARVRKGEEEEKEKKKEREEEERGQRAEEDRTSNRAASSASATSSTAPHHPSAASSYSSFGSKAKNDALFWEWNAIMRAVVEREEEKDNKVKGGEVSFSVKRKKRGGGEGNSQNPTSTSAAVTAASSSPPPPPPLPRDGASSSPPPPPRDGAIRLSPYSSAHNSAAPLRRDFQRALSVLITVRNDWDSYVAALHRHEEKESAAEERHNDDPQTLSTPPSPPTVTKKSDQFREAVWHLNKDLLLLTATSQTRVEEGIPTTEEEETAIERQPTRAMAMNSLSQQQQQNHQQQQQQLLLQQLQKQHTVDVTFTPLPIAEVGRLWRWLQEEHLLVARLRRERHFLMEQFIDCLVESYFSFEVDDMIAGDDHENTQHNLGQKRRTSPQSLQLSSLSSSKTRRTSASFASALFATMRVKMSPHSIKTDTDLRLLFLLACPTRLEVIELLSEVQQQARRCHAHLRLQHLRLVMISSARNPANSSSAEFNDFIANNAANNFEADDILMLEGATVKHQKKKALNPNDNDDYDDELDAYDDGGLDDDGGEEEDSAIIPSALTVLAGADESKKSKDKKKNKNNDNNNNDHTHHNSHTNEKERQHILALADRFGGANGQFDELDNEKNKSLSLLPSILNPALPSSSPALASVFTMLNSLSSFEVQKRFYDVNACTASLKPNRRIHGKVLDDWFALLFLVRQRVVNDGMLSMVATTTTAANHESSSRVRQIQLGEKNNGNENVVDDDDNNDPLDGTLVFNSRLRVTSIATKASTSRSTPQPTIRGGGGHQGQILQNVVALSYLSLRLFKKKGGVSTVAANGNDDNNTTAAVDEGRNAEEIVSISESSSSPRRHQQTSPQRRPFSSSEVFEIIESQDEQESASSPSSSAAHRRHHNQQRIASGGKRGRSPDNGNTDGAIAAAAGEDDGVEQHVSSSSSSFLSSNSMMMKAAVVKAQLSCTEFAAVEELWMPCNIADEHWVLFCYRRKKQDDDSNKKKRKRASTNDNDNVNVNSDHHPSMPTSTTSTNVFNYNEQHFHHTITIYDSLDIDARAEAFEKMAAAAATAAAESVGTADLLSPSAAASSPKTTTRPSSRQEPSPQRSQQLTPSRIAAATNTTTTRSSPGSASPASRPQQHQQSSSSPTMIATTMTRAQKAERTAVEKLRAAMEAATTDFCDMLLSFGNGMGHRVITARRSNNNNNGTDVNGKGEQERGSRREENVSLSSMVQYVFDFNPDEWSVKYGREIPQTETNDCGMHVMYRGLLLALKMKKAPTFNINKALLYHHNSQNNATNSSAVVSNKSNGDDNFTSGSHRVASSSSSRQPPLLLTRRDVLAVLYVPPTTTTNTTMLTPTSSSSPTPTLSFAGSEMLERLSGVVMKVVASATASEEE